MLCDKKCSLKYRKCINFKKIACISLVCCSLQQQNTFCCITCIESWEIWHVPQGSFILFQMHSNSQVNTKPINKTFSILYIHLLCLLTPFVSKIMSCWATQRVLSDGHGCSKHAQIIQKCLQKEGYTNHLLLMFQEVWTSSGFLAHLKPAFWIHVNEWDYLHWSLLHANASYIRHCSLTYIKQ